MSGQTTLILAASVQLLVAEGADVLHRIPSSGCSAIDLALIKRNREILSLVVQAVITKLCDETEAVRRELVLSLKNLAKNSENSHKLRIAYLNAISSTRLDDTQIVSLVTLAESTLPADAFAIVLRAAIANGNLHQTSKTAMKVKLTICTGLFSDAASLKDINPTEIKRCILSEFKKKHMKLKYSKGLDAVFVYVLKDPFFEWVRLCFESYKATNKNGAYLRPNRHKLAQAIIDGTTDNVFFGSCFPSASSVTAQLSLALRDMGSREPFGE